MKMKKFLSVIIMLIMVLSVNVTFAENEKKCTKCGAINHTVNMCPCVDVYINGELLETAKKAEIVEGRTLVPLRAVCEELGCSVIWKNNIRYAYIDNPLTRVAVGLEVDYITVWDERQNNGMAQRVETDVPAQFVNGYTMVPLNVIASALSAEVKWHNSDRVVSIKTEYSELVKLEKENLFAAKKDGAWIVLDSTGNELLENPPVEITELADKLIAVKKVEEGKEKFYVIRYGIEDVIENNAKNTELKYKTTDKYNYCGKYSFGENCVAIQKDDGSYAFLDLTAFLNLSDEEKKEIIVENSADIIDMEAFSNGLAVVKNSIGSYYIGKDGIQRHPYGNTYTDARNFKGGYAAVKKGNKWGFIDSNGEEITKEFKYDDVKDFSNGYAAVKEGDKWGFIDVAGNVVVEPIYVGDEKFTGYFSADGYVAVKKGENAWTFINGQGTAITERDYIEVRDFANNYVAVRTVDGWGFIKKESLDGGGNPINEDAITPKYEDVRNFVNGYAAVKQNGKWGYINESGEMKIEPIYDEAKDFNGILAEVKENGKWTFVDFGKRE